MDFIIGMFLVVLVLIMLINFASISISDSPSVSNQCSIGNLFSSNGVINKQVPITTSGIVNLNGSIKNNLISQKMGYDYTNYFFM